MSILSKKPKEALVFKHVESEGIGMLGQVLQDRAIQTHAISTPRANLHEIDPLKPDLLVVLGGPVGVYQAGDYPFITQEIEIIKARMKADLPTIGICLGAQMMASALGAHVYEGKNGQELGWHALSITPAGEQSPARHLCRSKTSMFHWHGDTFELPEGAALLASSDLYPHQIFQYEQNGLAMQCHPEVRRDRLKEWEVMFVNQVCGSNAKYPLAQWRTETDQHIDALNAQAELFFNEWLELRGL